MNPRRTEQIANRIQLIVSEIVQRSVSDPRLHSLVINRVELAGDGSFARIFVSSYMQETDSEETLGVLRKASGFIRKNLAAELGLRIVPLLRFQWDDSVYRGEEILAVIRRLKTEEN